MKETTLRKIAKTLLRHPFWTAFNVGVLLYFIAWAWLLHPASAQQTDVYLMGAVIFVLVFWAFAGGFGYTVQNSFITYIEDNGYRYKKVLLKVKNGKVIATGNCFWGTSGIYEVSTENYPFNVQTSIVCKVGPYCKITIPVTLFIEKTGDDGIKLRPYNYQELYEKVVVGAGVKSVEDYARRLIEKSIAESQQIFDNHAREYADQRISSASLLQRAILLLDFPDNALSNFDGFRICLADPIVSTCKGSSEGSSCSS